MIGGGGVYVYMDYFISFQNTDYNPHESRRHLWQRGFFLFAIKIF
jgi:hypothetical protein